MAEKTQAAAPTNFDEAMLAFQKLQVSAVKSGKNPHFKSNYATLEEVIKAASQANEFGLYFTQPLDMIVLEGQIIQVVQTTIVHAPTGEKRVSPCPVRSKDPSDAQKMGSGITYAKRYGLQAAFALPSADDDGNEASKGAPTKPTIVVTPTAGASF
jgi:hypothetical protein